MHNIITVPEGSLVYFEGVGLHIRAARNEPEFGSQPFVTINTEELPAQHVNGNGEPLIAVHLNDATLYDDEGKGNIKRGDSVVPS